jgi:hypothetical protein
VLPQLIVGFEVEWDARPVRQATQNPDTPLMHHDGLDIFVDNEVSYARPSDQ